MATSRSCIKYLKNFSLFLLCLMAELLQIVQVISSFPEVLCNRDVLKKFSKFTNEHKKQSSVGVLSKDVLKIFAKLTEKHISRIFFFKKVADWLKLSEAATGGVLPNKVF